MKQVRVASVTLFFLHPVVTICACESKCAFPAKVVRK